MVKTIITVKIQSVKRFVGEVFKWICLDFVAFKCSFGAVNPGSGKNKTKLVVFFVLRPDFTP